MRQGFFTTLALLLMLIHCATAQTYVLQVKPFGGRLWGYANLEGALIISPLYKLCGPFSPEGVAATYDPQKKTLSYVNLKFEKISGLRLDKKNDNFGPQWNFNGGLAPTFIFVEQRDGIKDKEAWGYIDATGRVAIPCRYDKVHEFHCGYAIARKDDQLLILNSGGEEIQVEPAISMIRPYSEGLAPCMVGKRYGFLDVRGEICIEPKFIRVGYFVNGLASAKSEDGLVGYIDKTGEWVVKPQFERGGDFDSLSGLARIRIGDRWDFVNRRGKVVNINDNPNPGKKGGPDHFADVFGDFSEGLAKGKKGVFWGFFDREGKWVIQPKFDRVRDFKNGFAAIRIDGKWGLMDKAGQWVIKPQFREMGDVEVVN